MLKLACLLSKQCTLHFLLINSDIIDLRLFNSSVCFLIVSSKLFSCFLEHLEFICRFRLSIRVNVLLQYLHDKIFKINLELSGGDLELSGGENICSFLLWIFLCFHIPDLFLYVLLHISHTNVFNKFPSIVSGNL